MDDDLKQLTAFTVFSIALFLLGLIIGMSIVINTESDHGKRIENNRPDSWA